MRHAMRHAMRHSHATRNLLTAPFHENQQVAVLWWVGPLQSNVENHEFVKENPCAPFSMSILACGTPWDRVHSKTRASNPKATTKKLPFCHHHLSPHPTRTQTPNRQGRPQSQASLLVNFVFFATGRCRFSSLFFARCSCLPENLPSRAPGDPTLRPLRLRRRGFGTPRAMRLGPRLLLASCY